MRALLQIIRQLLRWLSSGWRRECARDTDSPGASIRERPPEKSPDKWFGVAEAEAGAKHLKSSPPIPCQDAAFARTDPRPVALVADGAGSARLSHFGSAETVLRLSHLAAALEDVHLRMLDSPEPPTQDECGRHARRFVIHASETIRQLAADKSEPFKEFRCTLLAAIVGAEWVFWLKVGDGHVIREKNNGQLQVVGPLGKGEFANVTRFVEERPQNTEIACGAFRAAEVSGLALMTDGAAEKLVSNDGQKIAGRVAKHFAEIRKGEFGEQNLRAFLSDPNIWRPPGCTGDDKGIAFLSRAEKTSAP